MEEAFIGRLISGLAFCVPAIVALAYGYCTKRLPRMLAFAFILFYQATVYFIMAYNTYHGLDINHLRIWFELGIISLALVITIQIISTWLEERNYKEIVNNSFKNNGVE